MPGATGRGLFASLTPSHGVDPGGSERLRALPDASRLAANDGGPARSSRLDAEVGYGMALFGGGFTGTPNVGFGLSDAVREVRMGWRLTPAGAAAFGIEVNLDAVRSEAVGGNEADHALMLRGAPPAEGRPCRPPSLPGHERREVTAVAARMRACTYRRRLSRCRALIACRSPARRCREQRVRMRNDTPSLPPSPGNASVRRLPAAAVTPLAFAARPKGRAGAGAAPQFQPKSKGARG